MSIFHKPIKIRQQMQNTNCTRFAYRRIIIQVGFPRRKRVFHRPFFFCTAPLYFAKFAFSEIICFAKHPLPGWLSCAAQLYLAALSWLPRGQFGFAVLQWIAICTRAAFVRHPHSRAVPACASAAFALLGLAAHHRYLQSIIYPESLLRLMHSLGCSQLCTIPWK